ncbi:hypothetical protein RMQ97_00180 [Maricaulis sp. D1M11]|uniref:hypothetical protein n=1 Tax=Maricaulis sp. D1M11 TaxID=3076117 RepID=UPI0039B6A8C2
MKRVLMCGLTSLSLATAGCATTPSQGYENNPYDNQQSGDGPGTLATIGLVAGVALLALLVIAGNETSDAISDGDLVFE